MRSNTKPRLFMDKLLAMSLVSIMVGAVLPYFHFRSRYHFKIRSIKFLNVLVYSIPKLVG